MFNSRRWIAALFALLFSLPALAGQQPDEADATDAADAEQATGETGAGESADASVAEKAGDADTADGEEVGEASRVALLPKGPSAYDEALAVAPGRLSVPPPPLEISEDEAEALLALPPWEEPPPPEKIWSGRLEFGFNGSEGNTRQYTTQTSSKLKRETPASEHTLDFRYQTSRSKSRSIENEAFFEARHEGKFPDSPWSLFIHDTAEYDAFKAFDYRLTADAGVAYNFIDNDATELQTRLGAGFSREYGVPGAEYVPEGSGGVELEHQLTGRQKLTAKSDIFPDVRDWADFRARTEAAWEILVTPEEDLSLRLSLLDLYDSTPNGKRRNDLTYTALVVWDF